MNHIVLLVFSKLKYSLLQGRAWLWVGHANIIYCIAHILKLVTYTFVSYAITSLFLIKKLQRCELILHEGYIWLDGP